MNYGNALTNKVVKDAVWRSHRSTEHLTPMLTITFISFSLIISGWFEGRFLSFLIFIEPVLRTQYKKNQPLIEEDPTTTNN